MSKTYSIRIIEEATGDQLYEYGGIPEARMNTIARLVTTHRAELGQLAQLVRAAGQLREAGKSVV